MRYRIGRGVSTAATLIISAALLFAGTSVANAFAPSPNLATSVIGPPTSEPGKLGNSPMAFGIRHGSSTATDASDVTPTTPTAAIPKVPIQSARPAADTIAVATSFDAPVITEVMQYPGGGGVAIRFSPPLESGGSPIVGYEVSQNDGQTWIRPNPDQIGGQWFFGHLTNGRTYALRVRAYTASEVGPASEAAVVVPRTVPGPPVILDVEVVDHSAIVYWRPPTSDGGASITRYEVGTSPGGGSCSVGAELTCEITGLTHGQNYSFRVWAVNEAGYGPQSQPFDMVVPLAPPSPPAHVSAVGGYAEATVTWSPPDDDGGSPVEGYTVTDADGASVCDTYGELSCHLVGLPGGTAAAFQVQAFNAVGSSDPAPANPVWIRHAPAPPQLRAWPAQVRSWRGTPVVLGPAYTAPPGTRITRVVMTARRGGKTIGGGARVALTPGASNVTQRVWYRMSNGRAGLVARSQRIQVVRYDPPNLRAILEAGWQKVSPSQQQGFCSAFNTDRGWTYEVWLGGVASASNITTDQARALLPYSLFASFYGSKCVGYRADATPPSRPSVGVPQRTRDNSRDLLARQLGRDAAEGIDPRR